MTVLRRPLPCPILVVVFSRLQAPSSSSAHHAFHTLSPILALSMRTSCFANLRYVTIMTSASRFLAFLCGPPFLSSFLALLVDFSYFPIFHSLLLLVHVVEEEAGLAVVGGEDLRIGVFLFWERVCFSVFASGFGFQRFCTWYFHEVKILAVHGFGDDRTCAVGTKILFFAKSITCRLL